MFHTLSSSESHQFSNAQRVAELVSTHGHAVCMVSCKLSLLSHPCMSEQLQKKMTLPLTQLVHFATTLY